MKVGDKVVCIAAIDGEDKPRPEWASRIGKRGVILSIGKTPHYNVLVAIDGECRRDWYHLSELRVLETQLFFQFPKEHV